MSETRPTDDGLLPASGLAPATLDARDERVLEVSNLTTGYDGRPALEDVSLVVPRGVLVGVIGPNGGGKSTLFRAILGLLRPWRGQVRVLGRPPHTARPLVGYVPQRELVDWRFPVSVRDVVLMGRYGRLGLLRRPGPADRAAAERALAEVAMLELADRPIGDLSGGQQQRVFIARALAQDPALLLLDEPMSGVDAPTEEAIFDLLDQLRAAGRTVLMASHDIAGLVDRFDRLVFLNRRVIADGPPEHVLTEEHLRAAYGRNLLVVKVGDRVFAVEAAAHHS